MQSPRPFRVLVADTYPLVREGWRRLFHDQPDLELVGVAASTREVITFCEQDCPDVAIISGHLPALELLSELNERGLKCKVMVVSLRLGGEAVHRSLQAGVSGMLSLTSPTQTLLDAVRTVAHGKKYVPDEMSRYLVERISKPSLTSREQAVLQAMAEGQSNMEIGKSLYISEGTVKSHANRIFSKLEVNDRTQAVLAAIRSGWVSETTLFR